MFPTRATCLSTAINYNQIAFLTLYYYLFFNPGISYFFPIHTGRVQDNDITPTLNARCWFGKVGVDWGRIPTCTPHTLTLHAHTASTQQLLHVLSVIWAGQILQAHATSLENNLFCFGKATQSCSQISCQVNMFHVGAQITKVHASWHMCQLHES